MKLTDKFRNSTKKTQLRLSDKFLASTGNNPSLYDDAGVYIENQPYYNKGLDQFFTTENPNNIHLDWIEVDPKKRGQGVGTQTMKDLISYANSKGKSITLRPEYRTEEDDKNNIPYDPAKNEQLEKWYEKMGFKMSDKYDKYGWRLWEKKPESKSKNNWGKWDAEHKKSK